MYYPSIEEIKSISTDQSFKRVPIKTELLSDSVTAVAVLQKLKAVSSHCFMLESCEDSKQWGRYTFIGFDPILEFATEDGVSTITCEGKATVSTENPRTILREILAENKAPQLESMPTFAGGLVGYFSYDYIKYSEPTLVLDAKDEENFKDLDLMVFDKIICFDNYKQKIMLICNIKTENLEEEYKRGVAVLKDMENIVLNGEKAENKPLVLKSEFMPLFKKEEFCDMVEKARRYIYEGDIFQVVLSNRMHAEIKGSLLDTYRVLRTTNPSPYMFYFSSEDLEIAGASPETLVKLEGGKLFTFPLAGTRKRGETKEQDEALAKELLQDEKEIAEHNMLVDLGRNDIGKISKIGSVKVEKYMNIERFSHVMHIGSTVSGDIASGKDAVDAVDAILPAGTLSGAPKLRACEIINELEASKRGIYGGAVGYIDFSGNLDTCIAIRLAFSKNGKVFVRSGAGIVFDSVPEKEYEECINKAKAVMLALKKAEGGIEK